MGYFLEVFMSILSEKNSNVRNTTRVIGFNKSMYLSWETNVPPSTKWTKVEGVWIRGSTEDIESFEYTHAPISKTTIGLIRKHHKWQYSTTFHPESEKSLIQVYLPPFYIPKNINPVTNRKLHKGEIDGRIVLTWIPITHESDEAPDIEFLFSKVRKEEFEEYTRNMKSFRLFVDPVLKRKLKDIVNPLKEEVKDIFAKVLAEYIKKTRE